MTWKTGQRNGEGIGWTPEQIKRQAARRTNYERGIIATAMVKALEGGSGGKAHLRVTHFSSAAGYAVWFNGMMVKSLHVGAERVEMAHLMTLLGKPTTLSVTITRRDWDKFVAKAEATEPGATAKALARVEVEAGPEPAPPVPAPPLVDLRDYYPYARERNVKSCGCREKAVRP